MPEWQGLNLKISVLTGGITNKLYRIQLPDGGDYVVRVYGQNTELFIDRDAEMQSIRQMEPTGVAPRLVKYLPEKNVTIVEFIPGTPFENADFMKDELLEALVRPIRLIHSSGVQLPRLFDPLDQVQQLFKVLTELGPEYSEFDIRGTIGVLERISALADIQHSEYLPCHNDLLADNFILVEDRDLYREPVCLIDWEYAGMNTPYYEISDMFQEILVPRTIEEKILRIYWQDHNMDEHMLKTDMFKPFPDIYWFLWSLIQLNISNLEFDYYTYGKAKYETAQDNIQILKERYGLEI
jgi:thiamine kinase-like enzyme